MKLRFKNRVPYRIIQLVVFAAYLMLSTVFFNSCKKNETVPVVVQDTSTVTDADGNSYKTVKIGDQWWMAENLKVMHYRNGRSLQIISTDNGEWENAVSGAYCAYDPSNANSKPPGLLYNGYAVSDTGNIAPAGWHVPTDNDWKQLEEHLGMSADEANKVDWRGSSQGDKLKIHAPDGWISHKDVWGTNESGFTALAGSCRIYDGRWGDQGLQATGFWWSSSAYSSGEAWYRYLDYKNSNVFRSHVPLNYGFSVRCVKD